jgi:hypothetical protein
MLFLYSIESQRKPKLFYGFLLVVIFWGSSNSFVSLTSIVEVHMHSKDAIRHLCSIAGSYCKTNKMKVKITKIPTDDQQIGKFFLILLGIIIVVHKLIKTINFKMRISIFD